MPEVELDLEWPDGRTTRLYSPSTVILKYLSPGQIVSVRELQERGSEALQQASERVRARYGFACTRADEEERKLQGWAAGFGGEEPVRVWAVDASIMTRLPGGAATE
ncbi:MSMEG_0570 family nitrogen starvation response protein [Synechococcus sp. CS-1325]|uniref:MSMEG_0570 family nitrogen starvation response protein n=1 Tax=Synechococcus sp. CS-1325 TaxID=2847979 RepID=UPI000DB1F8FC|nr:MSMEG_0570 family nitrogen starvation response protein [Synechococcus sp. CS-1325]MCT0199578.1 MSMEG_0570 family nitrogen starvation response protein [Synechococcus sp. CS-1325]PZV02773.1 MAG: MSMEG_0570 family nitrogen starvation response protein [Cyanobium sp.]